MMAQKAHSTTFLLRSDAGLALSVLIQHRFEAVCDSTSSTPLEASVSTRTDGVTLRIVHSVTAPGGSPQLMPHAMVASLTQLAVNFLHSHRSMLNLASTITLGDDDEGRAAAVLQLRPWLSDLICEGPRTSKAHRVLVNLQWVEEYGVDSPIQLFSVISQTPPCFQAQRLMQQALPRLFRDSLFIDHETSRQFCGPWQTRRRSVTPLLQSISSSLTHLVLRASDSLGTASIFHELVTTSVKADPGTLHLQLQQAIDRIDAHICNPMSMRPILKDTFSWTNSGTDADLASLLGHNEANVSEDDGELLDFQEIPGDAITQLRAEHVVTVCDEDMRSLAADLDILEFECGDHHLMSQIEHTQTVARYLQLQERHSLTRTADQDAILAFEDE